MSENIVYDVAIIGGGLAGLCLAIQCANQNYKVILFEKEQYPFHKVCGEYISLESWNFLQSLGVDLQNLHLPTIKTLQLSTAAGNVYSFDLPLGGFGVSRFFLDNCLYTIAVSKGVEVITDTKVNSVDFSDNEFTVSTSDKTVLAKVAAGCYGKRSNLDVKWERPFTTQKPNALNNYIGIKYHIRFPHDPAHIFLHNFYNGYCGLSKIEDDKSCLCYLTTAENLRSCSNSIKELQKKVLSKNPRLKEIFSAGEFLYDQPLAISQVSFNKKSRVENHVFMLGDAAGMISPLCGNGMSMAMHSSKLAFHCIRDFSSEKISREIMENEYTQLWQKEFKSRLWIGRNVQRFFGGNFSTALFIRTMHSFPAIAQKVIRSTHGNSF